MSCASVLEHVENDERFFQKLLRHVRPGGVLVLTVDFHPSGAALSAEHRRTYTAAALKQLVQLAEGFTPLGELDYRDHGAHVNGYNFASLALQRNQ